MREHGGRQCWVRRDQHQRRLPVPRVQRGRFGACLMREPDLVADGCRGHDRASTFPSASSAVSAWTITTHKPSWRPSSARVADAGCTTLYYVHARKALLNGSEPRAESRDPAASVRACTQLKERFPSSPIVLNGGITTIDAAADAPAARRRHDDRSRRRTSSPCS